MRAILSNSELLAATAGLLFAAGIAAYLAPLENPAQAARASAGSSSGNELAAQTNRIPTVLSRIPEPPASPLTQGSTSFSEELSVLLRQPPGPLRSETIRNLIGRWAETDGPSALAAASSFEEPAQRFALRETAFRHWAKSDAASAWAFARANPEKDLPAERFDYVLRGLGEAEIRGALAFLGSIPRSEAQDHVDAAGDALDKLYQRGAHSQLLPWIESLPSGMLKATAVSRLVDQWARYDPAAAASWMETQPGLSPDNIIDARRDLASSWAGVNPLQALEYFNQLPPDQRENAYYEQIFKRWLDYDKNAAAAYLADLPTSPALDRPIEQYAYEVMNQNPEESMPWVESISDPRRRWKAITRVAAVWKAHNPKALATYVESADYLNDDQKKQLLSR